MPCLPISLQFQTLVLAPEWEEAGRGRGEKGGKGRREGSDKGKRERRWGHEGDRTRISRTPPAPSQVNLGRATQVMAGVITDKSSNSYLKAVIVILIRRFWGTEEHTLPKPFWNSILLCHFCIKYFLPLSVQGIGIITPDYVSGGNVCNLIIRTCNYVVKILRKL